MPEGSGSHSHVSYSRWSSWPALSTGRPYGGVLELLEIDLSELEGPEIEVTALEQAPDATEEHGQLRLLSRESLAPCANGAHTYWVIVNGSVWLNSGTERGFVVVSGHERITCP